MDKKEISGIVIDGIEKYFEIVDDREVKAEEEKKKAAADQSCLITF
ncbi:hypothetical protein [Crassaminicella profunda]|nr:hypothetical protein [Crassaminicella profunda]QZY56630.1 hypothetical protein K7H06_06845 [Crassaminicella profunda]